MQLLYTLWHAGAFVMRQSALCSEAQGYWSKKCSFSFIVCCESSQAGNKRQQRAGSFSSFFFYGEREYVVDCVVPAAAKSTGSGQPLPLCSFLFCWCSFVAPVRFTFYGGF